MGSDAVCRRGDPAPDERVAGYQREPVHVDHLVDTEDDGALDGARKLAHVAWPRCLGERAKRIHADRADR
jgi:hypothetical protein